MRNLKRALSLALSSVMLLGMMVVGTSAASYPDVDENDNVEAIEVLNAVNAMIGDRGNFRPDAAVNRHEMAVIMAKLVLGNDVADNYVGSHPFTDTFPWADKYVAACYENGIVSGTSKTTFSGNQPLTAVQAAAMMLNALGYKDLNKGASDWRAPLVSMANQLRLFNGVTSIPNEQLNRNQVAQLVLNTLKSPVVDLKDGTFNISDGNGQLIVTGGSREYIVRSSLDAYAKAISAVESKGNSASGVGGYTIELGEHLYNGKEIGTYAKTELLRAEYTTKVTGKMLYDLLGASTVKEFGINVTIDGNTDNDPKNFGRAAMTRTNTDAVGATGNGVLTQVYVDGVDKVVDIAIINTYLAIASGDYNEKKDDKFLVTLANGELKSMAAPEVLTEQTITSHKVGKYVVADKQYDYATTAQYDVEVMESFGSVDMKEVTYDIVLDKYGYLIGVEQNEKVDEYVFLTGVDDAYSHLSQKNVPANVIFMDGSMKTVTINAKKSVLEYSSNGSSTMDVKAETIPSQANMWCTYSVDSDGIYTLTAVAGETRAKSGNTPAIKVAQAAQNAGTDIKINSKNISLNGNSTGAMNRVHGNDKTVYINTTLTNVHVASGATQYYQIIDDVDTVTTGVTKVDMTVKNIGNTGGTPDYKAPVNEVYTLYNDKGVILGVVTLKAEDNATVTHYAYINSSKIDHRNYSAKEYSWYREAIVDGVFVMLKEVDDNSASTYLAKMDQGEWYEIKYNADGEVKGFFKVTYAANGTTAPDGVEHNDAKRPATKPTKQVGTPTIPGVQYSLNDGNWDKTLILQEDFTSSHPKLKYENGALYTGNNIDKGVYVPSDAKVIVFTEDYDKSEEFSGANMTNALNYLVDKKNFDGYVNAVVSKDGIATVVIIDEKTEDTDVPGPLNGDIKIIDTDWKNDFANPLYWIEDPSAGATKMELRASLENALAELGGSNFKWETSDKLTWTAPNGSTSTSAVVPTTTAQRVYMMTLIDNKDDGEAYTFYTKKAGSGTYVVADVGNVATATVDLNSAYDKTANKFKGDGQGFISNAGTTPTVTYGYTAYGSSYSDYSPASNHDYTVKTCYVAVSGGGTKVPTYAEYGKPFNLAAGTVTTTGIGYTWAVTSGDAAAYQANNDDLTIPGEKVNNTITITPNMYKVTGGNVEFAATNGTVKSLAKTGDMKGTGAIYTINGTSKYVAYDTAITGSEIVGDVVFTNGYVKVTVTETSDPTDDYKVTTSNDSTGLSAAGNTYVAVDGTVTVTNTATGTPADDVNAAIADGGNISEAKGKVSVGTPKTVTAEEKDITVTITNS